MDDPIGMIPAMPQPTTTDSPTEAHRWQPIDTAPEDGEQMLLWDGGVVVFGWFNDNADRWCFMDILTGGVEQWPLDIDIGPTHWWPLPEPPEDDVPDVPDAPGAETET